MVQAHRVGWRPSAKGAHELPRLHMCLELRRHPRHGGTGLLVPTSSRPLLGLQSKVTNFMIQGAGE